MIKLYQNINHYWNAYYKSKKKKLTSLKPSSFAVLFKKKYLNRSANLLEIGCGNGRDTFFFNNKVNSIVALDSSAEAIYRNKKIAKINNMKIKFINKNFESINYKLKDLK